MNTPSRFFTRLGLFLSLALTLTARAQPLEVVERVYKETKQGPLKLFIYDTSKNPQQSPRPAIVFFFGGGWRGGSTTQFNHQSRYLASRGMVAITVDYRVSSRHKTKAVQCVLDAKSAIRWVRDHADELGIDPNRIAAAGGSAGGHLAACTGVITGVEEWSEDLTISSRPNAMILFNPALVLAPAAGYPAMKNRSQEAMKLRAGISPKNISPFHHVSPGAPPTLIFHGQADTTVPFWTATAFQHAMLNANNRCELDSFPGMPHGFFNYGRNDQVPFRKTMQSADEFLVSLGYLSGSATIDSYLQTQSPGNP